MEALVTTALKQYLYVVPFQRWELFLMRIFFFLNAWDDFSPGVCADHSQNFPNGLSLFMDLTFMCDKNYSTLWHILFFICGLLYIFRKQMTLSLFVMSFLHTAYFGLHNSQGFIGHSYQLISLLAWMQFFSYLSFDLRLLYAKYQNPSKKPQEENVAVEEHRRRMEDCEAVNYAQQLFCASYMISALTKWFRSEGIDWLLNDGRYYTIQIVRTNEMKYYSVLTPPFRESEWMLSFLENFPNIGVIGFLAVWLLEMFPIVFLMNRSTLLVGGICLFMLHYTIYLLMQLNFWNHERMLVTFFMNLPFWIWVVIRLLLDFSFYRPISPKRLTTELFLNKVSAPSAQLPPPSASSSSSSSSSSRWSIWSLFPTFSVEEKFEKEATHPEQKEKKNQKQILPLRIWNLVPFKMCFLIIALCAIIKENYPFSHFPMYASIGEETQFVYMTDGNDTALGILKNTGWACTNLWKFYRTNLSKGIHELHEKYDVALEHAAEATKKKLVELMLARPWRLGALKTKPFPLKIWYRKIHLNGSVIEKSAHVIATISIEDLYGQQLVHQEGTHS